MIASEVAAWAQQLSNEQNVGQRWSAPQWLAAVSRAQKIVTRELKWPPSRFFFTTSPGVQEYQLQEVLLIQQTYVNGQIVPMTTLAVLEGQQIQVNDQSGAVGGPTGLVSPVNPPIVGGGQYTPEWSSASAAAYPVANSYGNAGPVPWFVGRRPECYTNGGNLGFVPAPIAAYPVVCRVVRNPVVLTYDQQPLVLPDICLDCVAWKVVELFFFSDKEQGQDSRTWANQEYQKSLTLCKDWKRTYEGGVQGPMPITYRSSYRKGQNQTGGDW